MTPLSVFELREIDDLLRDFDHVLWDFDLPGGKHRRDRIIAMIKRIEHVLQKLEDEAVYDEDGPPSAEEDSDG